MAAISSFIPQPVCGTHAGVVERSSASASACIRLGGLESPVFFGETSKLSTKKTSSGSRRGGSMVQQAVAELNLTQNKGLQRKGLLQGGRWLSCTTRHIRIYVGYIDPETYAMDQSKMDTLSILVDPDSEFVWPDDKLQRIYDEFAELVDNYAGADMTEYTLRLIGSDLEHLIRKMLLAGEIQYNLDCRVLNFSMGKPRYDDP